MAVEPEADQRRYQPRMGDPVTCVTVISGVIVFTPLLAARARLAGNSKTLILTPSAGQRC